MDYLNNYTRKCKDTVSGIKKVYLLPYIEYNETLIKSEGMSLTVFPESYVFEFDCEGSFNQSSSSEKGNTQFAQQVSIKLPKVYQFQDVNVFNRNGFRVIVLNNNNELIMFGTNTGMSATVSNDSGQAKSEFNGFNVTFDGVEEKTGLLIDDFDDFFFLYEGISPIFNYELNLEVP